VLASGDIGEGADWTHASARARSADRKLGGARAEAIANMLHALPQELRSDSIQSKVRDNRQVFGEPQLRANPFLNARIRAGIVAEIRAREDESRKGEPIPLC
jgi:CII-binding regulator of phage lambda lysogenization HflD